MTTHTNAHVEKDDRVEHHESGVWTWVTIGRLSVHVDDAEQAREIARQFARMADWLEGRDSERETAA